MSYFATLDGKAVADVATNSGWLDFVRWVERQNTAEALQHLAEYGWSEQLDDAQRDLVAAMKNGKPSADQRSIARRLWQTLRARGGATVLVVTDGIGEGTEEDNST